MFSHLLLFRTLAVVRTNTALLRESAHVSVVFDLCFFVWFADVSHFHLFVVQLVKARVLAALALQQRAPTASAQLLTSAWCVFVCVSLDVCFVFVPHLHTNTIGHLLHTRHIQKRPGRLLSYVCALFFCVHLFVSFQPVRTSVMAVRSATMFLGTCVFACFLVHTHTIHTDARRVLR